MPDSDKGLWQNMQQKSPHKFFGRQTHHFFLPRSFFVPHFKINFPLFHFHKPIITDSDAVSVLTKVVDHLLWTGKWLFAIYDELLFCTGLYKGLKNIIRAERLKGAI